MKTLDFLMDHIYSVSDIQDYFKYILKKHETVTDNSSTMIYVNKIENRIIIVCKEVSTPPPISKSSPHY